MVYESFSAEDTAKIAFKLGENARAGDIFCLFGELGAGKTVFAKGFAKGVGYTGRVVSPTFTIMNEYEGGRLSIYHFDLYRLENAECLEGIGYEEYFFSDGVSLVEWPEKIQPVTNRNRLKKIKITYDLSRGDNFREICVEDTGD